MPENTFDVLVTDNYADRDDPSGTLKHGSYATYDEALAVCMAIVDRNLYDSFKPGIAAAEMYTRYTTWGDDPYIVGRGDHPPFSAWTYAKQRCDELCDPQARNSKSLKALYYIRKMVEHRKATGQGPIKRGSV